MKKSMLFLLRVPALAFGLPSIPRPQRATRAMVTVTVRRRPRRPPTPRRLQCQLMLPFLLFHLANTVQWTYALSAHSLT